MSGLLKLEGLQKCFGDFVAIDGLSLELEEGELLALIGPNGAGKTTLLNLISGELRPDEGTIVFAGRRLEGLPPQERARLGIARTFQVISLFPELTVYENLLAAAHPGGLALRWPAAARERAEELLEKLQLKHKRGARAAELAHGEARRLELGLALAREPRLLLLDEPSAGLSLGERAELVELIMQARKEHPELGIILVEHDLELVRELADRVAVLHRGRLLALGTAEEIERNEGVRQIYLEAGL